MTRVLLFSLLVLGILALAVGGWTLRGLRRALTSPARLRPAHAA
jgi:hypothetical protein